MVSSTIYPRRSGLTRWRRVLGWAVALPLTAATGCSVPVTVPLAPLTGMSDSREVAPVTTGSIAVTVEEEGISEQLGEDAWSGMRSAVARAVEYGEDGETFAWRGLAGERGSIVAVAVYSASSGQTCRRLSITAEDGADSREVVADACLHDGNLWRVRPITEHA